MKITQLVSFFKMQQMSAKRRSFSTEEKVAILQEAAQSGITNTLNRHSLSYSVFSRWRQQMKERTETNSYPKVSAEIRILKEENALLKKIIANQALELEMMKGKNQD
jgi:putative transposase